MPQPDRQPGATPIRAPHAPDDTTLSSDQSTDATRVEAYLQYLYEGELERTQRLKSVSNTYIALITSTFTAWIAVVNLLKIDLNILVASTGIGWAHALASAGFLLAMGLLVVAFVMIVTSVRIDLYESLCNPRDFAVFGSVAPDQQVRQEIIANYAVAATHNAEVNEKRARWLARALRLYLGSIALFFVWGVISVWRSFI